MLNKYTIEIELVALSSWIQIPITPDGSPETYSTEVALAGLAYYRTQHPASSYRLIEWRPKEITL